MKVALLGAGQRPIPPPGYGGVERFVDEYARALARAGVSVRVVNEGPEGLYPTGWAFARAVPGLLGSDPEEIVHANTSEPAITLGLLGRSYVYTTHFPDWLRPPRSGVRSGRTKEAMAVRRARGSTTFSDALRGALERVPRRRGPVVTIPLGVDVERFRPDGLGDGGLALGVGEIVARKRWTIAARAVRGTGVRLRLVGPIREPALADELRSLGAEVVGEVDGPGLLRELSAAGVLLHPGDREAWPGVALQALAAGRPVLASGSLASLVGATVADSDSPDRVERFFRTTLEQWHRDPGERERRSQAARECAESLYAWDRLVPRYLAFYREVGRDDPGRTRGLRAASARVARSART